MQKETEKFLLHLEAQRNFSRHTVRAYRGDLRDFLAYAGSQKVSAPGGLTRSLMRGYISCLNARGLARNSLLRKISAVRSFSAYLISEGMLSEDPFDLITVPKREKRLPRFMSEICDSAAVRLRPFICGFAVLALFFCIMSVSGASAGNYEAMSALRAADGDRTDFKAPAVSAPEISYARGNSEARDSWNEAVRLYSDDVFKPKPYSRIDSGANPMVMLQGFHWYADSYWYHPPRGWWGVLADKAGEIGRAGFGLIWFPPVSNGSYYPHEWYNLDSQWGKKPELLAAVRAMHDNKVLVLGDIVLNHRSGTKDWADFTNPDWPTDVIVQNDEWSGVPSQPYNGKSSNYDEGQGDGGCRDIDHNNPIVRRDTRIFMRWMRNSIGFDGWRFDMVKGYLPRHIMLLAVCLVVSDVRNH